MSKKEQHAREKNESERDTYTVVGFGLGNEAGESDGTKKGAKHQ